VKKKNNSVTDSDRIVKPPHRPANQRPLGRHFRGPVRRRQDYGGSWNGVMGNVTGLFYGDAGQLVAQLIGVSTLIGFVFTFSFVVNWLIDLVVGQRVGAKAELEGLDLPEMGALCYPEFEIKAHSAGAA
jgi:Ammonium Transporter Family